MSIFNPFSVLVISILGIHLFGGARDAVMGMALGSDPEGKEGNLKLAAFFSLFRIACLLFAVFSFLEIAHRVFSYYGIA